MNYIWLLALLSSSDKSLTCFFKSVIIFDRGSSLTTGWLVIYDAFVAYVRVDKFYYKNASLGFMQAIIKLYEFPPMDCFRIDVSLESRYGTCTFYFEFLFFPASDRILITCLSVNKDLLMSILYLASLPSVPVRPILYEPAKSTNYTLLAIIWLGSEWWKLYNLIVKIEWLLEELMLSLWQELILFFKP